jgi:TRAP transporter 4TM/12TM fusion protein
LAILFATYPFFADHFPGVFMGVPNDFTHTISLYAFGGDGILGIPGRVMGGILMGFLVFAGFLISIGAGKFFLDASYALLGKYRGGPAKIAVVSSGFFGSLSGSIAANIVATGSVTIPAMKRMGYPPRYAAAIEACASTGGMLMPPVMGAVAFVMAALVGIPYHLVILAAAVPSFLYYLGLLIQADAYAAKVGMKGLPKEEIPSLKGVLKKGWPLLVVVLFLVWGLVYMRWEYLTPFYATALLIVLSFVSRETRITPKKFIDGLYITGRIVTTTMCIILPAGMVISAIEITGVGAAFASGVLGVGEGSLYAIMILGVLACYVMGMAGLIVSAYIFLAVTMAPAMIAAGGLNQVAVHLFIMYYSMIAFITPPVAPAAFIASAVAESSPLQTGLTCMRLGIVLYFIPFFFVFNPALILQGSIIETIYLFILAVIGITILAGGLEGYLLKVGILKMWSRPFLVVGGFLIALPQLITSVLGIAITVVVLAIIFIGKKAGAEEPVITQQTAEVGSGSIPDSS